MAVSYTFGIAGIADFLVSRYHFCFAIPNAIPKFISYTKVFWYRWYRRYRSRHTYTIQIFPLLASYSSMTNAQPAIFLNEML